MMARRDERVETWESIPPSAYGTSLEEVGLSGPVLILLTEADYETAGQVLEQLAIDEDKILGLKGVGAKDVEEIEQKLSAYPYPESKEEPELERPELPGYPGEAGLGLRNAMGVLIRRPWLIIAGAAHALVERNEGEMMARRDKMAEIQTSIPPSAYDTSLEEVGLSGPVLILLAEADYETAGQVLEQLAIDEDKILGLKGVGAKAVEEIEQKLSAYPYPESKEEPELERPEPPAYQRGASMGLRDLIGVLTPRLRLVIAGTALAMAASYIAFRFLTPGANYQATATVIIGNLNPNSDLTSLRVSEELAPTYAQWATRRPVLQGVIDSLSVPLSAEELRERIDVRVVDDTHLIEISAMSSDPQLAADIANEIVQQLERQIKAASADEDDLLLPSREELMHLKTRISADEAELISLGDALANYQHTQPYADDVAQLEIRIRETGAALLARESLLLGTESATEADLQVRRIDVLQSIDVLQTNLAIWREELDSLNIRAKSDSEAEIGQLVARINVLQSNLGFWQREYNNLRAEYTNRRVNPPVVVEAAQASARAADPRVNIVVAGVTGLVLIAGAIFLVEGRRR